MTDKDMPMYGEVLGVHLSAKHEFSKASVDEIELIENHGVKGDAHAGVTIQHLSRVARDPSQPNLRQVHLVHSELIDELREQGFAVEMGSMGENITTRGIPLLDLSVGTRLVFAGGAIVEITGLRNPCVQLDKYQDGLRNAVIDRDDEGNLVRRAGVMGIVVQSGHLKKGARVQCEQPRGTYIPLGPV
jgi:MOSC domain-containing protein YiiM